MYPKFSILVCHFISVRKAAILPLYFCITSMNFSSLKSRPRVVIWLVVLTCIVVTHKFLTVGKYLKEINYGSSGLVLLPSPVFCDALQVKMSRLLTKNAALEDKGCLEVWATDAKAQSMDSANQMSSYFLLRSLATLTREQS